MSTPADMREPTGPLMRARRLPVGSPPAPLCEPVGCQLEASRLPVGSPRAPFHKPGQTAAEQDVGKRRSRHGGSIRPERKRENRHIERCGWVAMPDQEQMSVLRIRCPRRGHGAVFQTARNRASRQELKKENRRSRVHAWLKK